MHRAAVLSLSSVHRVHAHVVAMDASLSREIARHAEQFCVTDKLRLAEGWGGEPRTQRPDPMLQIQSQDSPLIPFVGSDDT